MIKRTAFQFSKFASVGVINTLIDFIVYFGVTRSIFFFSTHIFHAKALSFLIATSFSFIANRKWTFKKSEGNKFKEALKFYLTVGSGIFINVGVHYLVVHVLGHSDILGIIAAAACTGVWGFSISKIWVFKK
jgi:putative flippase GtrA